MVADQSADGRDPGLDPSRPVPHDPFSAKIRTLKARRRVSVVVVFRRGPLDVALSLTLRPSQQTPHLQDEIYFIVRGQGVLCHDGKRDRFESGDLLFVAAGIEHQIEEISENFVMWRVFYGYTTQGM